MSECEHDELWAGLLRGHANRDLTGAERKRMAELSAAGDPERRRMVTAVEALHADFVVERGLLEAVSAPETLAEQHDESFARLSRTAADAEQELRHRLRHAAEPAHPARLRDRPRWLVWVLAASVLVAGLAIVVATSSWSGPGARSAPGGLLPGQPGGEVLGGGGPGRILMSTELRLARPVLEWHAVLGAARYRAVIRGADGALLLRRAASASTEWQLGDEEVAALRAAGATGLGLRVVAVDGDGVAVATTGELPLRLVD